MMCNGKHAPVPTFYFYFFKNLLLAINLNQCIKLRFYFFSFNFGYVVFAVLSINVHFKWFEKHCILLLSTF